MGHIGVMLALRAGGHGLIPALTNLNIYTKSYWANINLSKKKNILHKLIYTILPLIEYYIYIYLTNPEQTTIELSFLIIVNIHFSYYM